jgi:hypothetical protein
MLFDRTMPGPKLGYLRPLFEAARRFNVDEP